MRSLLSGLCIREVSSLETHGNLGLAWTTSPRYRSQPIESGLSHLSRGYGSKGRTTSKSCMQSCYCNRFGSIGASAFSAFYEASSAPHQPHRPASCQAFALSCP